MRMIIAASCLASWCTGQVLISPLGDWHLEIFHYLGFDFWNTQHICGELGLRNDGHNDLEMSAGVVGSIESWQRSNMSDNMFRIFKIYRQQEHREQLGWHR